jgi:hypothetical protein
MSLKKEWPVAYAPSIHSFSWDVGERYCLKQHLHLEPKTTETYSQLLTRRYRSRCSNP